MSFGNNEVSGRFNETGEELLVNEVFYTLQGEGPDSGRPSIFVRLSKCNLRCYFCDTEFEKGVLYPLHDLVDKVLVLAREHGCRLVVITGGEPLLQNIVPFVIRMNEFGLSCSIETAGTVMLPYLHEVFDPMRSVKGNLIVCSPKTPKIHPQIERLVGAWKYVVNHLDGPENWGLPTMSTQRPDLRVNVFVPRHPVVDIWVSPMDEQQHGPNERNMKHARDLALKHGYRLSLQVHKIVGVP
jgi:7-carboxy-7-deazaguanine synthase